MDDNNDEFCPMVMFKGMPITSNGLFHFTPTHELNAKALKKSLNALSSISTSHNPHNYLSSLGPSIPMLSNMTTPPPAPKREFKPTNLKGELFMLHMMKTSGMIECEKFKNQWKEKGKNQLQPRSFNQRANKMTEAIENLLGPGSNKDWPFNL